MHTQKVAEMNIRAGFFLLATLTLLVFGIILLSGERSIFSRQEPFFSAFRNVGGLSEGAPVRLGGISIGRVSDIDFSANRADPTVLVTMMLDSEYLERVRTDSIVSIDTQGLLGDKFVSISAGKGMSSEPVADPGSFLPANEPGDYADVILKAHKVVDNTVEISEAISEVLEVLKQETLADLSRGVKSFANLTEAIESGDGLAHRFFYSKTDADTIINGISSASKNLNSIVDEIKSGDGLLHTLIYDKSGQEFVTSLTATAKQLDVASKSIASVATEIRDGSGVLHELIDDGGINVGAKITESLNNIDRASASLRRASEALANGDGTLGALLVDSRVYDNLVEITDGAKRSFLLRKAIRSSLDR